MKRTCLLVLLTLMIGTGCSNRRANNVDADEEYPEIFCCPPTVYLQPCNNFTESEAQTLIPHLKALIKESSGVELDYAVNPPISLHDSLMNDKQTRYRADKIIRSIEDNHHDVVIVLTHQDISCSYKGKADWGILGLAMNPIHVCVVSDFRLKNKKRDLWKVAAHEFLHSYCGMHHCKNDDPTCIMKDAKGHADFSNKMHLCKSCKNECNI